MSTSWKQHFRTFLEAEPDRLHFAAHSHHPWPDVTFAAQQQAWQDAARYADEKWDRLFGEVWPEAQAHVARELALPDPKSIVFAPNTHALLLRILSCLPTRPRVLTTDSEFHSAERQLRRLEEEGRLSVVRIPAEPFDTFTERFVAAARGGPWELVFFSQVFFNSGAEVRDLVEIVRAVPEGPLVVIDGYHGFLAVPTDLSDFADRAFYMAGGYKYAMAGEGACFLHVPPRAPKRPVDTGWFAAFGALEEARSGQVPFAPDGMRFAGATMDLTPLYRLNAVMRWRKETGLGTTVTRGHAHRLGARFVEGLRALENRAPIREADLVVPVSNPARGQFLTFRTPRARELSQALKGRRVITDAREDRLRFGFGVYQDEADVARLLERVGALAQAQG